MSPPPPPPPLPPDADASARQSQLESLLDAAQRESRTYFEKSFHSSPALMSLADARDGKLIEVNPAFAAAAGFTREEMIGHTTLELGLWMHPAQRDAFIARIREQHHIRDLEADFRSKTGRVRTLLLNADLIELGGRPCMLTVAIDITERRRQERLQAATYQISQVILGGGDLPALFAEVHRIIGGLMSARNFYVALLGEDGTTLSFPYFVDETMAPPAPRPRRNGVTEYVLETGEPLLALDSEIVARLQARGNYRAWGDPCAQWMGAPLKIDGRSLGVIALQDYHHPQAYHEDDLRLLVFVADQTAAAIRRRQIETAQREARAYFEKSFHSSPALMLITRLADRRITEANPAFVRACGHDREQLLGRTADEVNLWIHPEQRTEFFRRLQQHGAIRNLECDFRAKSGATATFLVHADVIELGGVPSLLSVGIDITERRRREQVQAATYQISRAVLAGGSLEVLFAEVHRIVGGLMPARNFYVALASADGRELAFPYFADEHVAAPPPRPLGNGFTEYVLQSGRPARVNAAELEALLRARGAYQPLLRPAAQRLGVPLNAAGRTLGVIALQDYQRADAYGDEELRLLNFVAEQVAVAVQRHQAEAALRAAKEAADAASQAKSYFLASVSHELRTPLNGILGYTQILRRDSALTDRQRDGVRIIHESAEHLLALINDVLDFSKIEAGRIELQPADFDLAAFVASMGSVFAPRAREKGILLETALADGLPRWVCGDEQRLRQIVFNLMSNAVKFTATGGVVLAVEAGTEGAIRFCVSDTGPGIADEDRDRIFEPFTQVGRRMVASASGTGLGLAISRSLVERMGGTLRLASAPGRGSRFWFEVVLPPAVARSEAVVARRIVGYEGDRRRVLVVDDNTANRAVMVDMLAPLGFEVAEALTGAAALAAAETFQPDLVLMDLRLPGEIDGLEATRRLRRTPRGGAMRIIAVSASAYDLDRRDCLAAGCDAFLAKPFREEELWSLTARLLDLTWRQADTEETRTPFGELMEPPPAAEAAAIHELAAKGDVVGIRARAQALLEKDPKYGPFCRGVLDLAARFKMKAIRKFVGPYTG